MATLSLIESALSVNRALAAKMSFAAWVADQDMRGQKVRLFRDYADGNFRANLTTEMRKLLRINSVGGLNEFGDNYMDMVIQAVVDRLEVTAVEGEDQANPMPMRMDMPMKTPMPMMKMDTPGMMGNMPMNGEPEDEPAGIDEWIEDLLEGNRFDALQADLWEATTRDGDGYVMAYFDNDTREVKWCIEPAYDGVSGMLVLYETASSPLPMLAIKIWRVTTENIADTMRVNVYYADHLERYISQGTGGLKPYEADGEPAKEMWTLAGNPIGVPVIHFKNRKAVYDSYGMSEIENAVPLQDALNRLLYSLVMAAELTAFQIRWAKGFQPPAGLTPGMWITIGGDGLDKESVAELGVMDQATLAPFLDGLRYLSGEIGNITNTPRLSPLTAAGDNSSGEALKQREIGLIGKVRRFQTKAGNSLEDLIRLSHRIQQAFGDAPPELTGALHTRWRDAELRNDATTITNAVAIKDFVDQKTFLEMIAPVYGWDNTKIEAIMAAKKLEGTARIQQLGQNLPNFNNFNMGAGGNLFPQRTNGNPASAGQMPMNGANGGGPPVMPVMPGMNGGGQMQPASRI